MGAHFIGCALREQGHEVRLIAAQFVRPFVKSNQNDYCDAEAMAEAVERENMRFVPIKRETSSICKRGIRFRKGPASLRRQMPGILENADERVTARRRCLWDFLWQEWKHLQLQSESLNEDLEKIASSDEAWVRRQQIPGVGPPGGNRGSIGHRKRSRLSQGTRVRGLGGTGAGAMVHRRKDQAAGNQ